MKLDIFKIDGTASGEQLELSDDIFGVEPNDHCNLSRCKGLIWLTKDKVLLNLKERGEVRGGGKKTLETEGRGGARAGTSRSPLWVGGGTIFGPRPRDYRAGFD